MNKDIITQEFMTDLCKRLDGDETCITNDHVESNYWVQSRHNKKYNDLLYTYAESKDLLRDDL